MKGKRYEWRGPLREQLWDNRHGCWAIWTTVGGQIGTTAEFRQTIEDALNGVPSSELAAAQEEGRVLRVALEFALDEWAAETTDCDTCGKPMLESFYIDEARAEAKPTDGGGE